LIKTFTVGIIVKNGYNEIPKAILSILLQTCQDFELIIVDDFSTDKTREYLKTLEKNKKIKVFYNREWKGKGFSRNFIIKNASQPYIVWQDADDISYPDRLEKTKQAILKGNSDFIFGGMNVFVNGKYHSVYNPNFSDYRHIINYMLIYGNPLSMPASCIKKEFYDEYGLYPEDGSYLDHFMEEVEFWIKAIKKSKISFIQEPIIRYNSDNTNKRIQNRQFANGKDIANVVFIPLMLRLYSLQELFPMLEWDKLETEKTAKKIVNDICIAKLGYKYFWRI